MLDPAVGRLPVVGQGKCVEVVPRRRMAPKKRPERPALTLSLLFQSKLVCVVGLNTTLFACSALSFLLGTGLSLNDLVPGSSKTLIAALWLTRLVHCAVLSLAYWVNFFDLLLLFSAKHLIPIVSSTSSSECLHSEERL